MSPDPYNASAGTSRPQSWNRYAYVEGDPINFADPKGLWSTWVGTSLVTCGTTSEGVETGICTVESFGEDEEQQSTGRDDAGRLQALKEKRDCDRNNYKSKRYLDFMDAYRSDAQKLADSLNVSVEEILGVAVAESAFGGSRIAQQDHKFFGLHAPQKPFPGQTGVDAGPGTDGLMAVFSSTTGFFDSGAAFVSIERPWAAGISDPMKFATAIHAHGYGIGTTSYVSDLINIIQNVADRLDCP